MGGLGLVDLRPGNQLERIDDPKAGKGGINRWWSGIRATPCPQLEAESDRESKSYRASPKIRCGPTLGIELHVPLRTDVTYP